MAATLTVAYPVIEGMDFDHDYYAATHMPLVDQIMTPLGMTGARASKGLAGGPDVPTPFHAVAVLEFPDLPTLQAALGDAGQVLADIPNYYSGQPVIMIGETI